MSLIFGQIRQVSNGSSKKDASIKFKPVKKQVFSDFFLKIADLEAISSKSFILLLLNRAGDLFTDHASGIEWFGTALRISILWLVRRKSITCRGSNATLIFSDLLLLKGGCGKIVLNMWYYALQYKTDFLQNQTAGRWLAHLFVLLSGCKSQITDF